MFSESCFLFIQSNVKYQTEKIKRIHRFKMFFAPSFSSQKLLMTKMKVSLLSTVFSPSRTNKPALDRIPPTHSLHLSIQWIVTRRGKINTTNFGDVSRKNEGRGREKLTLEEKEQGKSVCCPLIEF